MNCKHCKMDTAIRNPSGFCDHLYYPDNDCAGCHQDTKQGWRERLHKRFLDEHTKMCSERCKLVRHNDTGSTSIAMIEDVESFIEKEISLAVEKELQSHKERVIEKLKKYDLELCGEHKDAPISTCSTCQRVVHTNYTLMRVRGFLKEEG